MRGDGSSVFGGFFYPPIVTSVAFITFLWFPHTQYSLIRLKSAYTSVSHFRKNTEGVCVCMQRHTNGIRQIHTIPGMSISGEITVDFYFLLYVSKVPFSPVSIYDVSKLRTRTIFKGQGNLTN